MKRSNKKILWLLVSSMMCILVLALCWFFSQNRINVELVATAARGHSKEVMSISFAPDGNSFATAGHDDVVLIWSANSRNPTNRLHAQFWHHGRVLYSPDGAYLIIGDIEYDGPLLREKRMSAIRMVDGKSLELNKEIVWGDAVRSIAISPDGALLAVGYWDDSVNIYNFGTGAKVRSLSGFHCALAFTPDGGHLISSGPINKERLRVYSTTNWKTIKSVPAHYFMAIAVSPDGKEFATGGEDSTVRIWQFPSAKLLHSISVPQDGVWDLEYSPDGKYLAIANGVIPSIKYSGVYPAGRLLFWNTKTNRMDGHFTANNEGVRCLAYAPGGSTIVTGGADGSVMFWMFQ